MVSNAATASVAITDRGRMARSLLVAHAALAAGQAVQVDVLSQAESARPVNARGAGGRA